MDGTLMDDTGTVLGLLLQEESWHSMVVFTIFMLLSALTLMNMLIGVLCEVVSAVGAAEKEEAAINLVKRSVLVLLKRLDADGSGEISREELRQVLVDPEACEVLGELEVD